MLTHVRVPSADAELAADLLWQAGAHAVEERPSGDGFTTLIADATLPVAFVAAGWEVVVEPVVDDGLDAWRVDARPWRAGRFVVQPPWVPPIEDQRVDDVTLLIDPGRAFGSGSHPTTRMALAALDARVRAGDIVLDLGCGSGVLAVAAARLGAQVTATDIDAIALQVTEENAVRNGVSDRIAVRAGGLDVVRGSWDVVVANVPLPVVLALAIVVDRRASLVLTGFLDQDVDAVLAAFPGRSVVTTTSDGEWRSVVLTSC